MSRFAGNIIMARRLCEHPIPASLWSALTLSIALAPVDAAGAADCNPAHSIVLEIRGHAPAARAAQLEDHVLTELRAGNVGVCPDSSAGVAHVQIRATLPDHARASIRIEPPGAPALVRELDLSAFPPDSRASAIASSTYELLRSALARAEVAAAPAAASREPISVATAQPLDRPATPWIEAGLALAPSSHAGQRRAVDADLFARIWLHRQLAVAGRFGAGTRLSRPSGYGAVQAGDDVHAAIDLAVELLPDAAPFGVLGEAGFKLWRVGFDELVPVEPRLSPDDERPQPLDHDWALAGRVGVAGSVRTEALRCSLAFGVLLPVEPAESDWGNTTSLDGMGVELLLGIGIVLFSKPAG
jgi:hypothetical protein